MADDIQKLKNSVNKGNYSAENITWLEGLEAVRHRPGMYIGDVGRTGLFVLCREVLDNSTDEAMGGHADDIVVRLLPDNVVAISDNGRGIPVDIHPKTGRSALELVMTELHAGGKFDEGNYKVAAGLHGVGVSVVNALSTWVEVEVKRDGKLHKQRYEKGIPVYETKVIGTAEGTGTTVTYQADTSIFTTDELDIDLITKRLRELSYLIPSCKYTFENHRVEPPVRRGLSEQGRTGRVLRASQQEQDAAASPRHSLPPPERQGRS
jgi:DNA gyrase subunit B